MITRIARLAAIAALAAGVATAAGAAAAAMHPGLQNVGGRTPATAKTSVAPQFVAGDRGNWARTGTYRLKVTVTGGAAVPKPDCGPGSPDCYIFQAVAVITGTWKSLPGAFTPRQNIPGRRIAGIVHGTFTGTLTWDFDASGYPYARLVPGSVTSLDLGTWYRRFFGPGTRFGGKGLDARSFTYQAGGCAQKWTVSAATGNGQGPGAGNITGGRACQAAP